MSRPLGLLAVCLIAAALILPATALGAPSSKRAQLTNVSVVGRECATGANKGGAHEGSVKFSPNATTAGSMDMTVVIRHALPGTLYNIFLEDAACGEYGAGSVTTDSQGNGTVAISVPLNGSTATSFWAYLYDDPTATDSLATGVVTF
jgi:hypothetical protein